MDFLELVLVSKSSSRFWPRPVSRVPLENQTLPVVAQRVLGIRRTCAVEQNGLVYRHCRNTTPCLPVPHPEAEGCRGKGRACQHVTGKKDTGSFYLLRVIFPLVLPELEDEHKVLLILRLTIVVRWKSAFILTDSSFLRSNLDTSRLGFKFWL